jgi:hypothetical protein
MNKIVLLFIATLWASIGDCRLVAASADTIPKDQQALIEGICYSMMMSPIVKENWPDLRSFNIISVTGENIGNFSKTEAVVGPGQCVVTVEVKTRQRGSATLILTFEAEAGGKYVLRPVYRGSALAATIQNSNTGEFVAKTWNPVKRKKTTDPETLLDTPSSIANTLICSHEFRRVASIKTVARCI